MYEGRMTVRTGRAVARPVRVARTHAPRVLLAAVALIVALSQVNIAYALPWQEKDGYPLGEILMNQDIGHNRGTVVYGAANEFFSTLCLIGRKSDYLQLSSEQLSELSGEGTGGAFYELSQRWSNLQSDGPPDTWPLGISAAMQGQGLISSPQYIWYADYSYYESDSLYKRALDDYMTIYNGGHLGGGGGDISGFVAIGGIRVPCSYTNSSITAYDDSGFNAKNISFNQFIQNFNNTLYIREESQAYIDSIKMGTPVYIIANTDYSYGVVRGLSLQVFTPKSSDTRFTFTVSDGNSDSRCSYTGSVTKFSSYRDVKVRYTGTGENEYYYLICTDTFSSSNYYSNGTNSSDTFQWWYSDGSSGGGGGGGGGGTWPEPDPNPEPEPPRVPEPEPGGPGIDLPDPYNPIVEPTPEPDPITDPYVVVVAPDSTDIIEWLRAILRAINNLGDKLNAESTELQNALNKVFFNNLSRLLKNLKGEFIQDYTSWLNRELQWLNSEIHDYFVDMQNYLYRLFDWLADQMNFEFNLNTDPYDDTSLLNWLRRIYNKLGADSGPNTRPVDPSTDEDGFLDWLRRMIQNFILDLGAAASDVVSDLGDLLSRLFAKFPFSVPWDLLAILGILDAPTMVPRLTFDIPLTFGTSTFTWHVDIDLQAWSAYMEAVRTITLVSFISWLIWLTPQVLRDLDPGDFL